jgi:putative DNA primase/helicase
MSKQTNRTANGAAAAPVDQASTPQVDHDPTTSPGDDGAGNVAGPALTHHQPHHLPWNRFSRPKRALLAVTKPEISAGYPNLDDLAHEVWRNLRMANEPPFLFRHDGKLCRVEEDDTGAPVAVSVDAHRMHFTLVKLFDWKRKDEDGQLVDCRPPKDLASHLIADPDPPAPLLRRIVTAPVFTRSGRLLDHPGDYEDGILYLPPKAFRMPPLPAHPSQDDIRSAVDFINGNLLPDFSFVSDFERANCFAALITPLVREMIDGPTPMFWVDKSKGGSGGTLLSSIIAAPILGAPPAGINAPRDEAEWNRVILSTLLRSPNVFFIDNCNDQLSSEALAHGITAARYEGRIIGSSKNESAEVRCLWIINGNNLRFGWELARRVVRIRIDPGAASPDQQDSRKFVHKHLLSWVIAHRAEVMYHLLILVNAWQASDRPLPADGTPGFGSFDSWREVVGGILNAAGVNGFLLNLEEARAEADQESATIRAFIAAWRTEFGSEPVSAAELLKICRGLLDLPESDHAASIRVGLFLTKYQGQIHDGSRIERQSAAQGRTQWRLRASE